MEASPSSTAAAAVAASGEQSLRGREEENLEFVRNVGGDKGGTGGKEPDSQTPLLASNEEEQPQEQQQPPPPAPSSPPKPVVSKAASEAVKQFSKLKPKPKPSTLNLGGTDDEKTEKADVTGVASVATESTKDEPVQEETERERFPSITVSEPTFDDDASAAAAPQVRDRPPPPVDSPLNTIQEITSDLNANTEKKSQSGQSTIQFSDLVMSALTSQASEVSSHSSIEICVYLMDNSGLTLVLEEGRTTTSDFVLDVLLEELKIPRQFKACFGIWLSSPLLHLQLRPTQVPYKMAKHWKDFLIKFTLASGEQLEIDEPILRLQRNVFLSPSAELKIDHPEVIRLLYCEAKENVLEGLYPLDVSNCYELAGLSAVNDLGRFSTENHPHPFYKKLIPTLLPEWIEKSRSTFLGCDGSSLLAKLFSRVDKVRDKLSFDLQRAHETATEQLSRAQPPDSSNELGLAFTAQRQFLRHCYELPFYGCAFFRGMLYKPPSFFSALWNLDKSGVDATYPITIAVSLRGVCLLDLSTAAHLPGSMLLSVRYSQLHWMTAELSDTEDEPGLLSSSSPAVLPSIFFHFRLSAGASDYSCMLQIVSKQAHLVDALMQGCVQLHQSEFINPSSPSKTTNDVLPNQVFGSGVNNLDFSQFTFEWEKEEEFLLPNPGEEDACLTMQLERLKLKRAVDFDDD